MTLGIPFWSHLMHSGGAIRAVATWHILTGEYLYLVGGAFGFLAGFQFPRLGLKSLCFLLHFLTSCHFRIFF